MKRVFFEPKQPKRPRAVRWPAIRFALSLCLFGMLASAAPAALGLAAEWRDVQDSNYEALERAPVRRWGNDDLQEPLRRIRRAIEKSQPADAEALRQEADAAYKAILDALRIEVAGDISVSRDGAVTVTPEKPAIVLYRSVPDAIVFRVGPSARKGNLRVAGPAAGPVRIESHEVNLRPTFGAIVVLPVVSDASPGKNEIELTASTAGATKAISLEIDIRPSGILKGRIISQGDGEPLTAKLFIEDDRGRLYVAPGETNYRTQSWYGFFQPRFSYLERDFEIPLPPGRYRVTAMKGYGYADWEREITLSADQTDACDIEMERLSPLESEGWYSADMHIHGNTPLAMRRAEDVNVAAQCHYSSAQPRALRTHTDESDATHLSCDAQEIEHWNFGNAFYFGIPTTVQDPPTPDPKMTPFFVYDEQSHRMGGVNLRWLRGRPFSPRGGGQQQPEIAVDAALGYMDTWSVLDNSMQQALDRPIARWTGDGWPGTSFYERTYKTWYGLLNCGIRITASAGTSYGRLTRLGFNRVYAHCPEALSAESFAAALKRGDGFVTNGPLLWLLGNGRLPGDGIALEKPGPVTLSVRLASRYPIDTVEILQNGEMVATHQPDKNEKRLDWNKTIQVERPSWFAARCFGTYEPRYPHSASHNHFAHTNPLFVTVGGERPRSAADAERFTREIDALIEFAPNIPGDELRRRSLEVFKKARLYFSEMTAQ